jgi:TrmH family RNA methyltransferase
VVAGSADSTPQQVRFVLVRPRSAGNVGAVARALTNLDFDRLDLVRPSCDPRDDEARRMAVAAVDLLDAARVHQTLDEALDGARIVVGVTRRSGKHRQPHWRIDALAGELSGVQSLAVVFGPEDHGLTDTELDRCTHLAHLPSSAAYGSFNLSQAVLLVAHELRRVALEPADVEPWGPVADHTQREAMYQHLEPALLAIGFIHSESQESIMRRLRRLLGRARPTEDEVSLLRGLARQILWSAKQAGLVEGSEDDGEAGTR